MSNDPLTVPRNAARKVWRQESAQRKARKKAPHKMSGWLRHLQLAVGGQDPGRSGVYLTLLEDPSTGNLYWDLRFWRFREYKPEPLVPTPRGLVLNAEQARLVEAGFAEAFDRATKLTEEGTP